VIWCEYCGVVDDLGMLGLKMTTKVSNNDAFSAVEEELGFEKFSNHV
jgi:hypothetical protein